MNKNYFDDTIINALNQYINSDNEREKNKIIELYLYDFLRKNAESVIYSCSKRRAKEDETIELVEFALIYLIPRIEKDKINAAQNYIYQSMKNRFIVEYKSMKNKNYLVQSFTDNIQDFESNLTTDNDYINTINADSNRIKIIQEIDNKLKKEMVMNKTKTVFLQLLRQYILDNDFNVYDFREYIMKIMKINKSTFWNICSSLNIRSKVFNEEISKKYLDS